MRYGSRYNKKGKDKSGTCLTCKAGRGGMGREERERNSRNGEEMVSLSFLGP